MYGNRNAPRARREEVNYDENNAYDSMLSDEMTDPGDEDGDDGQEMGTRNGPQKSGDAIDGIFDHKRSPDHGSRSIMNVHDSALKLLAEDESKDDWQRNIVFLVKWQGYSHLHSALYILILRICESDDITLQIHGSYSQI